MASPFDKNFDDILHEILIDYSNLDSAPDTSEGSMVFIMGSVLASMQWGLYRYQDWIRKQQFPDTADTEALNHWGAIYDVTRASGDTDAEYLEDILAFLRQPPAGGNKQDFEDWALDSANSKYVDGSTTYYNAYVNVVSQPDGVPGTVGVYTIPNDETIVNNGGNTFEEDLRAATEAYIESKRPLGMLSVSVFSSDPVITNVTIEVTAPDGETIDTTTIQTAIENELNSMAPGQSLHRSVIEKIAIDNGAKYANMTTPAISETTVDNDEHIRAGTVTVTVTEV